MPLQTTTYNSGSGNYVATAATNTVTCMGGGGGGESATASGGGGGGGGLSIKAVTLTPGNSYAYAVGAGGAKDTNGGDSTFGTTTVVAKGGVKGSGGNGGAGGAAGSGTGDTKYSGGDGANSDISGGGGGGSSAGTGSNGNNGSGQTGGTAPTGGFAGGDGAALSGNPGSPGAGSGAAGGGGKGDLMTPQDGGAGQNGFVKIVASTPATITNATGPSNGNKTTGTNLDITLTTDYAITIATATPYIVLTIGAASRNAEYLSGSGTTTLVFRYQVQAGDLDTDGISCASSITANGATLRDSDNIDMTLTFTPPTLSGVTVNVATSGFGRSSGLGRRVGGSLLRRRVGRRL